jgi:putative tryptophan/tyrosine transport system substrate-binding protein
MAGGAQGDRPRHQADDARIQPADSAILPVFLRDFADAAATLAAELSATPVHDEAEIEAAVSASAGEPDGGLIAAPDPFVTPSRANSGAG